MLLNSLAILPKTPLYGAPCLVVISTPIENPAMGNVQYSNAAMMAEHMCLMATDLGIGSCNIWGCDQSFK